MNWSYSENEIDSGRVLEFHILNEQRIISFEEFLKACSSDDVFRTFLTRLLKQLPFRAIRWETPGVSKDLLSRDFRFVAVNSPGLERTIDWKSFEDYFETSDEVVIFQNLGKTSTLIVPTPGSDGAGYGHLLSFLRTAPEKVCRSLFKKSARELLNQIQNEPDSKKMFWFSTAGGGVSWLHVRIDPVPKYYSHGPYRNEFDSFLKR